MATMDNDISSQTDKAGIVYSDYIGNIRTMQGRNYFSQAGQDLFVLAMLNNKKHGFYIEIGGADPFESNNTFLLEKDFFWKGFSIEFDKPLAARYSSMRNNPCFCDDAIIYDYGGTTKLLNFPTQIDYLSVDIDPVENTYLALKKCHFDKHRFSVITFEHDAYVSGTKFMKLSRTFLESNGYQLVAKNVKCFGRDFEDWWIDPNVIPESTWSKFVSNGKEFSSIFEAK
jgi:hypothetical protein